MLGSSNGGFGVTKLEAEPQDGPVEYKLHLLLRPRRRLSMSSTVLHVSGSHQSKSRTANAPRDSGTTLHLLPSVPAATSQSRQNRLQNLTTQLLWRLQQSSSFHSSAKSDLVIPTLSDPSNKALVSTGAGKPLSGLEESQGALYEIGVSDDGTLVGLTEDELQESLSTLRIMASSLGCRVEVLRKMIVGTCRWTEETNASSESTKVAHEDRLWVAEAQVAPNLGPHKKTSVGMIDDIGHETGSQTSFVNQEARPSPQTEQLRVSLTGSTTSGKSSLLGTLSTSTLDNGRGKSRLSLLKHRHEIASGVTSSIVTELIGYHAVGASSIVDVVNFAYGNVSSWSDIHSACEQNRLVVMTDSAGHPRYRRTTVRGLLSWAPHWTMCCIAADDEEHDTGKIGATATSSDILGPIGVDVDMSRSHLELCLSLGLPLVIVVTKLDLASNFGLRETLRKVLTILKAAGRQPMVLSSPAAMDGDQKLQAIDGEDHLEVTKVINKIQDFGASTLVPIVLTSSVTGAGICKLHALLYQLPVPESKTKAERPLAEASDTSCPGIVFHVDEVFSSSQSSSVALLDGSEVIDGHILSGHLSCGTTHVGDTVLVGPFASDTCTESSDEHKTRLARSCPPFKDLGPFPLKDPRKSSSDLLASSGSPRKGTLFSAPVWRKMRIVSLRNLRLPVRQLLAGQVGTIGVAFDGFEHSASNGHKAQLAPGGRMRKGMVLLNGPKLFWQNQPFPCRRFSAIFKDRRIAAIAPGSSVIVYIASIRASAKILTLCRRFEPGPLDEMFQLDEPSHSFSSDEQTGQDQVQVDFKFLSSTEWFEMESQVLVMPERTDAGSVGLEGFVGTVRDLT